MKRDDVADRELLAALKVECSIHFVRRVEHQSGILEEQYSDGSKRFTGAGGGVLWIIRDGLASVGHSMLETQKYRLLLEAVSRMEDRPLEISDLDLFKAESLMMLEALRSKNAQFFRDMGLICMPEKRRVAIAAEHRESKETKDDEVLRVILNSAAKVNGLPEFDDLLERFRKIRGHAGEEPWQFKKKLKVRGYEWLCAQK